MAVMLDRAKPPERNDCLSLETKAFCLTLEETSPARVSEPLRGSSVNICRYQKLVRIWCQVLCNQQEKFLVTTRELLKWKGGALRLKNALLKRGRRRALSGPERSAASFDPKEEESS